MGSTDTLDVVARDRLTLSVVTLSSFGSRSQSEIRLQGEASFQSQPEDEAPLLIPILATISTQDAQSFDTRSDGERLIIVGHDDSVVGPDITSYSMVPALGGKYQIHSAVITENGRQADAFAISDIFHLAIVPLALAACVALYAAEFVLIQQTINSYKAAGLVPKWRIRGSIAATITCRFDVEIEGTDPHGKVVRKQKVHIGRKKK